jgi:hypothetical protein
MGKMINAYRILSEKPGWKITHGRTRSRLENNIKMGTKEARWKGGGL